MPAEIANVPGSTRTWHLRIVSGLFVSEVLVSATEATMRPAVAVAGALTIGANAWLWRRTGT